MGYVSKALSAHLKSNLHTGFTAIMRKVADINESDIIHHTISLADLGLPHTAKVLLLSATRISGTGLLYLWPIEETINLQVGITVAEPQVAVAIINERLEYSQSVANDDFDLWCSGYWTEGRLAG